VKKQLKRILYSIKENKIESFLLAVIILVASFLRFYKITELQFFTYDQARDDLIVKRILVDHKLTLLGPQSSIGGVYSPPFYYYTIAVPLLLFGFNPIGVDIYTAFVGVLTVLLIFLVARAFFGKPAGIFAAGLYATSPVVVELSRRAWNPNTLPFFSLLTLVLAYCFWQTKNIKVLLVMSLVFGYTLSLHYSTFCLLPVIFYLWWDYLRQKRRILPILTSFLILDLFFLPLLIFEFRHDFSLSKNLISHFFRGGSYYFNEKTPSFWEASLASVYEIVVVPLSGYFLKGATGASAPYEFAGRVKDVISQFAPVSIIAHRPLIVKYHWWGQIIFIAIVIFSLARIFLTLPKDRSLAFIWLWFITAIIVTRLYRGTIYFFYYLFLYPVSFLFFVALLKFLFQKERWLKILTVFILLAMIGINFRQSLVYETSGRTIRDIKAVAQIISQDVGSQPFNLAASYKDPDRWDHHALDYRYFIEAYFYKKPLDWYPENYHESETLYLISETRMENPVGVNIMEVREFDPQTLVKSWNYKNEIFIYKLAKK